jgi:hypothetical protein
MFRLTFCACLAALLAGSAAGGADKSVAPAGQWAGTYRDAQVTLELKTKPDGAYEGAILFSGQTFPLSARAAAGQLNGSFRTADGSFDFTATRAGDTVTLATGGKTYELKRPAANPLAATAPAVNPLAAAPGGGAPAGYSVATVTDHGKKLVAHKAEAKSVPAALNSALQDMSRWFDSRPNATSAFADAKDHRRGGAPFTATLKGKPVKGLVFCVLGDTGADITVTYCRSDAPASEWAKLSNGTDSSAAAAVPGVKMEEYAFPDGTGSVQFPAGWKTSARTCIHGVRIEGPAGQWVTLGQSYSVNTPDSFIVQNQMQLAASARQMGFPPPKQIEMLVAPYTGPLDALKNLVPQLSRMSQTRGGPAVSLDKILEEPKPAQASFPNGQAADLYFAFTQTTGGVPAHYRSRSRIETWLIGTGAWSVYFTELVAPDASFDKDFPAMLAIATSLKLNSQAVQRETGRAIDAQNANFRAMQRAHATQQEGFEDYFKSMQRNSTIRDRSAANFDEMIRGVRTVEDTRTGERTSVDLGNVDQIVDRLNEHDPGRYEQIPLRDELYPLPPEPNR